MFILFLQELGRQASASAPHLPILSANLKCHPSNTEDSLCNWVQLSGVNILLVPIREN
jgi:hypothetical protein